MLRHSCVERDDSADRQIGEAGQDKQVEHWWMMAARPDAPIKRGPDKQNAEECLHFTRGETVHTGLHRLGGPGLHFAVHVKMDR